MAAARRRRPTSCTDSCRTARATPYARAPVPRARPAGRGTLCRCTRSQPPDLATVGHSGCTCSCKEYCSTLIGVIVLLLAAASVSRPGSSGRCGRPQPRGRGCRCTITDGVVVKPQTYRHGRCRCVCTSREHLDGCAGFIFVFDSLHLVGNCSESACQAVVFAVSAKETGCVPLVRLVRSRVV